MTAHNNTPTPRWVKIALAGVVLFYLVYSTFGIAAPFYWGHHGYGAAVYMLRARMSLRFHMLAPANYSGFEFPPRNAFYFHLPIGYHHLLTLLVPIFGEHEWVPRAVAIAGGLTVIWALWALVRRYWSPTTALVAVVLFVTLPIVASFSVLSDPMMPTMACQLWSLRGLFMVLEGGDTQLTKRGLIEAGCAYGLGCLLMWDPFFVAPYIALFVTAYWFTARGRGLRFGGPDGDRFSSLWAHTFVTGTVCVVLMALHAFMTWRWHCWGDIVESYGVRSVAPAPQYILDRHLLWIQLLYGKPPVILGALWFTNWLARLATGRARRRDLAPLTFLYLNTLWIYLFPEGTAVHLYRVYVYSGFFTLAGADLIDTAYHATVKWWGGRGVDAQRVAALLATTMVGVYLALEVPRCLHNLVESRVMMGTHGLVGYKSEADKWMFAHQAMLATRPDERIIVHYGELGARKEMWFYMDRNFDELASSLNELSRFQSTWSKSVLMLDERALSPGDRTRFNELMKQHPVTFYDHYALVDLRSSTPGVRGYTFVPDRSKMTLAYRYFVSHVYAPLKLVRRTYLPGACTALSLGVPVATDEELAPPPAANDAAMRACYTRYLQSRGAHP